MSMDERLSDLADLKVKKDEIRAQESEVNAQIKKMEEAIYESFVLEGVTSMKTARGHFGAKVTERYSVKKEDKEATMAALKEHYPDLVVETVNAQTLSAFMREAVKTGEEIPKEITDGLSSYQQVGITWRRSS